MKVLVWNIEKFTDAKFRDGYIKRGGPLSKKRKVNYWADEILAYMGQVFNGNGNPAWRPDVIAILEVLAPSASALGAPLPAGTPYADGLIELLGYIKHWTTNDEWRLVPPLKCNPPKPAKTKWAQSEVVGVFYDNSTIRFDGPNGWSAGASQPNVAGLATEDYPAPWNTPSVTLKTQNAGMVRFYSAAGAELTFPGVGNRHPFVVDFTERGGAGRRIRFGFVHTSPGFHTAGTREFARVTQMTGNAPADPAITVFAGDFNVNDYDVHPSAYAYGPLMTEQFVRTFTPAAQKSTRYRGAKEAEPHLWSTYQEPMLIDNFLVRLKGGAAAPVAGYPKAAVNCAEGWPAPPYVTSMEISIANLLTAPKSIERFRYWENFWHIRKCSDHVPTFLDIT